MESRINILNELQEISPEVARISFLNPYKVPAGYFEELAEQILWKAKAGVNPYKVPDGYFEGLAEAVLKRVKAEGADTAGEELEILSPLLSKIGKKSPY